MQQPGKLMAKSRSQPVNLPGARPLMNPLDFFLQHIYLLSEIIFLICILNPGVFRQLVYILVINRVRVVLKSIETVIS